MAGFFLTASALSAFANILAYGLIQISKHHHYKGQVQFLDCSNRRLTSIDGGGFTSSKALLQSLLDWALGLSLSTFLILKGTHSLPLKKRRLLRPGSLLTVARRIENRSQSRLSSGQPQTGSHGRSLSCTWPVLSESTPSSSSCH